MFKNILTTPDYILYPIKADVLFARSRERCTEKLPGIQPPEKDEKHTESGICTALQVK